MPYIGLGHLLRAPASWFDPCLKVREGSGLVVSVFRWEGLYRLREVCQIANIGHLSFLLALCLVIFREECIGRHYAIPNQFSALRRLQAA
jgi:hypothetical protein